MSQQKIICAAGPVCGTVSVPGSKSMSNRALLIAAMCEGESILKGLLWSDDTEACVIALQDLGVKIDRMAGDAVRVTGCVNFHSGRTINCRDAGTVARFLIPIAAAMGGEYEFYGTARLSERPLKPLLDALIEQGVEIFYHEKAGHLPLKLVSRGLYGGKLVVDIKDSSQFVSGLLLAAPKALTPLTIFAEGLEQKPYVKITLAMRATFGVVGNCGAYQAREYLIEPDASTASYFFAAAALTGGKITIPGLHRKVLQGDIRFLEVLEKMGAKIAESAEGISVTGPQILKGLGEIDMREMSDTFMTLAAIAPFADAPTTITGLRHTRLQESDRVEAMRLGLNQLGAQVTTTEDSISIAPSVLHGGIIDSHRDHRIAMSHALIGLKVPGVVIDGAECVKKTCPQFFELWAQIKKCQ